MSLDREQMLALEHAGTVGFPSPYPAAGQIKLVVHGSKSEEDPDILLNVVHQISPRLRVSRLVRLEHARAIQFHGSPSGPAQSSAKAKAKPEEAPAHVHAGWTHWMADRLHDHVKARAKAHTASGAEPESDVLFHHAILHVPETAPVLMHVDVGMTAAESAEYYPPLPKGTEYHFFCESKVEK
ncbi:MAG TPA: hypothetical protein VGZ22_27915 [Isosphaeraceae bacterium]|nr:hypothetical protein [Isosphaeraceae bacterium]